MCFMRGVGSFFFFLFFIQFFFFCSFNPCFCLGLGKGVLIWLFSLFEQEPEAFGSAVRVWDGGEEGWECLI